MRTSALIATALLSIPVSVFATDTDMVTLLHRQNESARSQMGVFKPTLDKILECADRTFPDKKCIRDSVAELSQASQSALRETDASQQILSAWKNDLESFQYRVSAALMGLSGSFQFPKPYTSELKETRFLFGPGPEGGFSFALTDILTMREYDPQTRRWVTTEYSSIVVQAQGQFVDRNDSLLARTVSFSQTCYQFRIDKGSQLLQLMYFIATEAQCRDFSFTPDANSIRRFGVIPFQLK